VPETDIAGVIGVDPKTLRRHYPQELRYGHVKANAKVAENLFRKATREGQESVIAAIFWMKTRAQWKETSVTELAGPPPKLIVRWQSSAPTAREHGRMAENLYKKAIGEGPEAMTATIFWLKTRAQWKETAVQEQHVIHSPVLRIVRQIVSPNRQGDDANSLVPAPVPVRFIRPDR